MTANVETKGSATQPMPRPWVADHHVIRTYSNGDADLVCECPQGAAIVSKTYWPANAALIVRAVNCHDDLVAEKLALEDSYAIQMRKTDAAEAEVERLRHFVDYENLWCWRDNVTDRECVGVIMHHPVARARKLLTEDKGSS